MNESAARDKWADRDKFLVGPSWVAAAYGVPSIDVHNAIRSGRLQAIRIRGHKADGWAIDIRTLPDRFPYPPHRRNRPKRRRVVV